MMIEKHSGHLITGPAPSALTKGDDAVKCDARESRQRHHSCRRPERAEAIGLRSRDILAYRRDKARLPAAIDRHATLRGVGEGRRLRVEAGCVSAKTLTPEVTIYLPRAHGRYRRGPVSSDARKVDGAYQSTHTLPRPRRTARTQKVWRYMTCWATCVPCGARRILGSTG